MTRPDFPDERLRDALKSYNEPPSTPREEMWEGLRARLRDDGVIRPSPGSSGSGGSGDGRIRLDERRRTAGRPTLGRWGWVSVAAAASAVLLLGVGLGRMTAPGSAPERTVSVEGPAPDGDGAPASTAGTAVRTAAVRHLQATESLLSLVAADARTGRLDGAVGRWGHGLLVETRLLLDSPAGDDPALRELLQDLELILAQVAMLDHTGAPERGREELRLIARGLEQQEMMARIQTVLPSMEPGLNGI